MILNCILVYDSIPERFFRTPGPWTKHFSAFYFSFNKQYNCESIVFCFYCVKHMFLVTIKIVTKLTICLCETLMF